MHTDTDFYLGHSPCTARMFESSLCAQHHSNTHGQYSAPQVAHTLSKSCPASRGSTNVRSKLAKFRTGWPNLAAIGRCLTNLGQVRPNLANCWPNLEDVGGSLAKIGRSLAEISRCGPSLAKFRPNSPEFGRNLAKLGRLRDVLNDGCLACDARVRYLLGTADLSRYSGGPRPVARPRARSAPLAKNSCGYDTAGSARAWMSVSGQQKTQTTSTPTYQPNSKL